MPRKLEDLMKGIAAAGFLEEEDEDDEFGYESSDESDDPSFKAGWDSAGVREWEPPKELKDPFQRDDRKPEVEGFRKDVSDILNLTVENQKSEFAAGGQLLNPPLVVVRVEQTRDVITFPIYDQSAAGKIIQQFQQAPFGKGNKTVVDKAVRNSWQLNAKDFKILNGKWESFMNETVVPQVAAAMSISSPITASLYKFLLYETGSFFKSHRDSEKEEGMFGTLIIQLPSYYSGGNLQIRHGGKSKDFCYETPDADGEAQFNMYFTALFADCEHEVFPITSGYRACLVYNLTTPTGTPLPPAPPTADDGSSAALIAQLQKWPMGEDDPIFIAYYLAHKYTKKSLSVKNLKTTDAHVASLLQGVSAEIPLHVYLCQVSLEMSGHADNDEDFDEDGKDYMWRIAKPSNCNFYPEDGIDVEVEIEVSGMIGLDDRKFQHKKKSGKGKTFTDAFSLDARSGEVLPLGIFKTLKPDTLELQPTGNEGVELEKWYKGAALLFWPESANARMLNEMGIAL